MTPRETFATIDAANWRADVQRHRDIWFAWHIAALSRAKRMPPLQRLLGGGQAKALAGKALEKRRREHQKIRASINVDLINEVMRDRGS